MGHDHVPVQVPLFQMTIHLLCDREEMYQTIHLSDTMKGGNVLA